MSVLYYRNRSISVSPANVFVTLSLCRCIGRAAFSGCSSQPNLVAVRNQNLAFLIRFELWIVAIETDSFKTSPLKIKELCRRSLRGKVALIPLQK